MAVPTDHVGILCDVLGRIKLLIGLYCLTCQSNSQLERSITFTSFVPSMLLLAVCRAHGVIEGQWSGITHDATVDRQQEIADSSFRAL